MERSQTEPTTTEQSQDKTNTPDQKITDVVVDSEVMALNMLVSFVAIAQKRGAFSIEESAKIWECVKFFQTKH
jgi:hypothetical protein